MNLLELVTHLRVSLLDDVGGHGIFWDSIDEGADEAIMLRWSNEELTRFINEAERKVAIGTSVLKDIEPSFQIQAVAGQYLYDVDPRIIRIRKARWVESGRMLDETDMTELDDILDWETVTGTPTNYVVDYEMGKLAIYPTPTEDSEIKIWAIRLPLNDMSWDDNETCKPEIPVKWQLPMLYYAAHLAYLKDEANSLDPQAADKMLARFVNEFDFNSAYVQKRRATSRGRTVKYGGLTF